MTNSQRLATVRLGFANWLAENASPADTGDTDTGQTTDRRATLPIRPVTDPPYFRESILIRKGFYCGRRLDAGGFEAVWFFEEDQLKIYGPSDELRAVVTGEQIDAMANRENTADRSEPVDTRRRAA